VNVPSALFAPDTTTVYTLDDCESTDSTAMLLLDVVKSSAEVEKFEMASEKVNVTVTCDKFVGLDVVDDSVSVGAV
jgi:hypothetical protein